MVERGGERGGEAGGGRDQRVPNETIYTQRRLPASEPAQGAQISATPPPLMRSAAAAAARGPAHAGMPMSCRNIAG